MTALERPSFIPILLVSIKGYSTLEAQKTTAAYPVRVDRKILGTHKLAALATVAPCLQANSRLNALVTSRGHLLGAQFG